MGAARVTPGFLVRIVALLALCLAPVAGFADRELPAVRNYHPFAQVFGLPGFADARVLDSRQVSVAFNTTVVSHADAGSRPAEAIRLDGESYLSNLAVGIGVRERLTLGIDVPFVTYSGGIFDSAIESWHDLWGFPNGNRDGPHNELFIGYTRDGVEQLVLDSAGTGIGDVRLEAAYRLAGAGDRDSALVLRAGAKLPTGAAGSLRGSDAADFSLDLAVRKAVLAGGRLLLVANAGAVMLGSGDVLPQLQRDMVGYAGAGAVLRFNERWRFNLQLYAQTSYFRSDLRALGADSMSLTVGGSYTWVASALRLSVAVMEDPVADITPDVALQIELRKDFN